MDLEKISTHATATATAASGGFTVFSGYSLHEWGIIIGIVLTIVFGVANLLLSYHFKMMHYKLRQKEVKMKHESGID